MAIVFAQKFSPKNTQIRYFWSKLPTYGIFGKKYPNKAFLVSNLGIFVSSRNFAITLIRRCWLQIWQYFFQIPAQKYPNHTFFVPNLDIFVFSRNLQLDNFASADFKYDSSFFQIPAQKYPNKAFLVRNFRIFIFSPNFATSQIRGFWFETWK